jgi:hypothetical protein
MRISIFSLAIIYNVLSFDTKQKENHVKCTEKLIATGYKTSLAKM